MGTLARDVTDVDVGSGVLLGRPNRQPNGSKRIPAIAAERPTRTTGILRMRLACMKVKRHPIGEPGQKAPQANLPAAENAGKTIYLCRVTHAESFPDVPGTSSRFQLSNRDGARTRKVETPRMTMLSNTPNVIDEPRPQRA